MTSATYPELMALTGVPSLAFISIPVWMDWFLLFIILIRPYGEDILKGIIGGTKSGTK